MQIKCDRCNEWFSSDFFWYCHIGFHWAIEQMQLERKEQ